MRFRDTSLTKSLPSEGGGPLAVEGVAAQTMKMFYGKNIETALRALSLTLVPRKLLDVCLQTRQSLCDMPAGSL